jgi:hypothetical protein
LIRRGLSEKPTNPDDGGVNTLRSIHGNSLQRQRDCEEPASEFRKWGRIDEAKSFQTKEEVGWSGGGEGFGDGGSESNPPDFLLSDLCARFTALYRFRLRLPEEGPVAVGPASADFLLWLARSLARFARALCASGSLCVAGFTVGRRRRRRRRRNEEEEMKKKKKKKKK